MSPNASPGRTARQKLPHAVSRLLSARSYSTYLPRLTDSMSIRDGMAARVAWQLDEALDVRERKEAAAAIMQAAWRSFARGHIGIRLDHQVQISRQALAEAQALERGEGYSC